MVAAKFRLGGGTGESEQGGNGNGGGWGKRSSARTRVMAAALAVCGAVVLLRGGAVELMVGDCCNPNMCSKYALEACTSPEPRPLSSSSPSSSSSSSFSLSNPFARKGRQSGVDRRHPGAAEAAAALGLHLVSGGESAPPLRSLYGERRDDAAAAAEKGNSGGGGDDDDDDGPVPPTVGLIRRRRSRHEGALRAAEAFGLHVSNLGGGGRSRGRDYGGQGGERGDEQDSSARASLSQGDGGGHVITQKLDLISAPIDAFTGELGSIVGSQVANSAPQADSPPPRRHAKWQGLTTFGADVAPPLPTRVGGVAYDRGTDIDGSYSRAGAAEVGGRYEERAGTSVDGSLERRGGTQVSSRASRQRGTTVNVRGDKVDYTTDIRARAVDGGDGWMRTLGVPLDGNGMFVPPKVRESYPGKGDVDTKYISAGGFESSQDGKTLSTPSFTPPAQRNGPGAAVWTSPRDDWPSGSQDGVASIVIVPPSRGKAEAHLTLEVFCPPYEAPVHGSVVYEGKRYRKSTAQGVDGGSSAAERKFWDLDGRRMPIAEDGDIPEGEQVRVECNDHYSASSSGFPEPRCLSTGEWEPGITCEPIMCPAYAPPEHGAVWPNTPVMAGETVTVYCDHGYLEYDGISTKSSPGQQKLVASDPWWDYNDWFGGANQGRGNDGVSRDSKPSSALASVRALGAFYNGHMRRGKAKARLARAQREAAESAREAAAKKASVKEVPLSKAIGHMTEAQLDRVVESYVDAPAPPTPDAHHHHRPSRHLLSILQEPQSHAPQRRGRNNNNGPSSSLKSGGGNGKAPRKKSPMCLDVGDYEKGITCRFPAPEVARAPPADAAGAPPDTHPAPSEETVTAADEMGVVCPSYITPEHGSVWQGGKEHRIATASGAVPGARVRLSCHEHYRPSRLGSHEPQCLPSGQWENGISCERIYCDWYRPPENGRVDTTSRVPAGERVRVTCDPYYVLSRPTGHETDEPACTDKGDYEKGAVCAPVPCPKASPQPCIHAHQKGRRAGGGGGGRVGREFATQEQIRDWEDDFDHEMANDYAPNVFDHEPRPTTWQT